MRTSVLSLFNTRTRNRPARSAHRGADPQSTNKSTTITMRHCATIYKKTNLGPCPTLIMHIELHYRLLTQGSSSNPSSPNRQHNVASRHGHCWRDECIFPC